MDERIFRAAARRVDVSSLGGILPRNDHDGIRVRRVQIRQRLPPSAASLAACRWCTYGERPALVVSNRARTVLRAIGMLDDQHTCRCRFAINRS